MSGNNAQKLNFGFTLGQAARQRALDHIHLTGKNLPASIVSKKGSIATVKFETDQTYTLPNVTIPVHTPEWLRIPYQKGDFGVVISGDVTIGNVTGLGPNTPPSFTRPGNLAPLIFVPVGNTNFKKVDDNKHVAYGPNGAQIATKDFSSIHQADPNNVFHAAVPTGTIDPTNVKASDYKHSTTANDTDGVVNKSTKKVDHDAPNVNVNATTAHTITSPQTNISGNTNIGGLLQAASAIFGSVAGGGGGAAPMTSGASISGTGATGGSVGALTNPALAYSYQRLTPVTTDTILLLQQFIVTIIDPASGIAALTIDWPASPPDGLIQILTFTQAVTTITHSGVTFGTNMGFTAATADSQFRFIYDGITTTWFRI